MGSVMEKWGCEKWVVFDVKRVKKRVDGGVGGLCAYCHGKVPYAFFIRRLDLGDVAPVGACWRSHILFFFMLCYAVSFCIGCTKGGRGWPS